MTSLSNSGMSPKPDAKSMPGNIAVLYQVLTQDLQTLFLEWRWFNELYDSTPETLAILNRTARSFFGRLQQILIESISVRISKLLDKATGTRKRRPNASIENMIWLLKASGEPELSIELTKHRSKMKGQAEEIEIYRSRVAAHPDLAVRLGEDSHPDLKKPDFEAVLEGLEVVLNKVATRFNMPLIGYKHVVENGGAQRLLFWLSEGLTHAKCRASEMERLKKTLEDQGEI